jgi:hypothetical protein
MSDRLNTVQVASNAEENEGPRDMERNRKAGEAPRRLR